jgi:transcriptional regulator with XRE-family HTH domain
MNQIECIGYRLQLDRRRLGLSQTEMGEVTGVSRAAQAGYEGGRSTPDVLYALKASAAGVDLDFLLTGKTSLEASIDKFDWTLAEELMAAIHTVSEELHLTISHEKLIPLLKILYRLAVTQKSSQQPIDSAREVLRAAA